MNNLRKILSGTLSLALTLESFGLTETDYVTRPLTTQTANSPYLSEARKKELSESADWYLNEFFDGYIDFMQKHSKEIKKNVKMIKKEGVVKGYAHIHKLMFDVALERAGQRVNEKDIEDLVARLIKYQAENARETYIEYNHPDIKRGYTPYTKSRVGFFKSVIETNRRNEEKDFNQMIRNSYTREELKKELEEQNVARQLLYKGFGNSLAFSHGIWGWFIRLFGREIVKKTGEKSGEYQMKELNMIYDNSNEKK